MQLKKSIDRMYLANSIQALQFLNSKSNYKISHNTLFYLDIIDVKKKVTVSELAEMLNVAKSAITSKVKKLEELELIIKEQSTEDKRVFYISLKPDIAKIYEGLNRPYYDAAKFIEKKYTKEQVNLLCEMLDCISSHIENDSGTENNFTQ